MKVKIKTAGPDRRFDADGNRMVALRTWQVYGEGGAVVKGPFDTLELARAWIANRNAHNAAIENGDQLEEVK